MTSDRDDHRTTELRTILKSQYRSALRMLRGAIEELPDELWLGGEHHLQAWQIAYHALFYTHFYLADGPDAFVPWEHHGANKRNPTGIPGPADPPADVEASDKPYSRDEVLQYADFCDAALDAAIDAMDVHAAESGFYWYPIPKLEHQLVSIRHIQHHAAQLSDRVRAAKGVGIEWVGAVRPG